MHKSSNTTSKELAHKRGAVANRNIRGQREERISGERVTKYLRKKGLGLDHSDGSLVMRHTNQVRFLWCLRLGGGGSPKIGPKNSLLAVLRSFYRYWLSCKPDVDVRLKVGDLGTTCNQRPRRHTGSKDNLCNHNNISQIVALPVLYVAKLQLHRQQFYDFVLVDYVPQHSGITPYRSIVKLLFKQ